MRTYIQQSQSEFASVDIIQSPKSNLNL